MNYIPKREYVQITPNSKPEQKRGWVKPGDDPDQTKLIEIGNPPHEYNENYGPEDQYGYGDEFKGEEVTAPQKSQESEETEPAPQEPAKKEPHVKHTGDEMNEILFGIPIPEKKEEETEAKADPETTESPDENEKADSESDSEAADSNPEDS